MEVLNFRMVQLSVFSFYWYFYVQLNMKTTDLLQKFISFCILICATDLFVYSHPDIKLS